MVYQVDVAHTPPELRVYAAYYSELENAAYLRDQLLAGNTDFEYAFIDASMVVSSRQVLAATFRAMTDYLNDRLKSRNIHSEIVFALSPNNNIGEAFRRFGIGEATKDLIVLKVATTPDVNLESVQSHLTASIKGHEHPFDEIDQRNVADIARIRKVYKTNSTTTSKKVVNGEAGHDQDEHKKLEVQIIGLMALRGAS